MADAQMRDTLKRRLRELGISAREASRRAGFNLGYVGDIIDGRSKRPDAERVLKLAEALDMDAADLLGDSPHAAALSGANASNVVPFAAFDRSASTIPLFSTPMPLNRQFVPFSESPSARIPWPAALASAREPFAAIVPNNASAPRYFAGETIVINPAVTAAPGDFVWVRRKDGDVAIARFAELGRDSFKLEFLGLEAGDRFAEVPSSDVQAISKIVLCLS